MVGSAPKAAHAPLRPAIDEPVALQALVVLGMLCELAERVAGRRAFGSATKKGHGEIAAGSGSWLWKDGIQRMVYYAGK